MSRPEPGNPKAIAPPLVSVGLPVFNGERFLVQALESILEQTYSVIEVIISDNASTDATFTICQEYARRDRRVRYVRQPRNIGAPRNWNFVAVQARGKYFKWASANDYCDRRLIDACVQVLEAKPDVVLCYGRTCLVGDDASTWSMYQHDFPLDDDRPSDRVIRLRMLTRLNNAVSGVIRADALRRTGLHRLYPGGDKVLMAELACQGKFHLIDGEPLFYRRVAPGSFSSAMSAAELRDFLTPGQDRPIGSRFAIHRDDFAAILRAPIPLTEKLRCMGIIARSAYWEARRAMRAAPMTLAGHD